MSAGSGLPLLLPKPSTARPDSPESSPAGSSGHSSPALPKRRGQSLIAAACSGCRKRKSKCDGRRPICSACIRAGTECIFLVPEGLSSRDAVKQKLERLSRENDALKRAFESLRTGNDVVVHEIIKRVKAAPNVGDAIASIADAGVLQPAPFPDLPSSPAAEYVGSSTWSDLPGLDGFPTDPAQQGDAGWRPENRLITSRREHPNYVFERTYEGFANGPPHNHNLFIRIMNLDLPISRWTTVCNDDTLLNHLMTLFWTWDNYLSRCIDRHVFFEDLISMGSTEGAIEGPRFCSSFLVNALLAMACIFSVHEGVFGTPGDMASRGRHFADAALQLLEPEQANASFPLFQGLLFLWVYEGIVGNGDRGWGLLEKAYEVHGELLRREGQLGPQPCSPAQRAGRVYQAKSYIFWGFYSMEW